MLGKAQYQPKFDSKGIEISLSEKDIETLKRS